MKYMSRIADSLLDFKLESFGATLIVGSKGCGKTTTAKQKANSFIELQDEDNRDAYLAVANAQPSKLLVGKNPRLIDEWQDAPKIWGAVRKSVDDRQENGLYILTGSTSQAVKTPHSGTMRISRMEMLPMSLCESGESNGQVSIEKLFSDPNSFDSCTSDLSMDELIFAICRGGWPRAVANKTKRSQLAVAKDLFVQTCEVDISSIDDTKRNPRWCESILRSYARNICTLAETKTIKGDAMAATEMGETSFFDYAAALGKLFIISDVDAWCPAIRSKAAIRASRKRNFVDPSLAVAALGISPEFFNTDFKTLGFLFECLCIRDLRAYSCLHGGNVSYYRDRYGLEADCVLHLHDGRYALIEFKLGQNEIDDGAKHLCEIERLVQQANEKNKQCPIKLPSLKMVITATKYGYIREDGVVVVPIGCLKP